MAAGEKKAMTVGKVTIYYLAHVGKGIFDDPEFTKAFRKADVIDFEAYGRVEPHVKKMFNAVSSGNREAYESLTSLYRKKYRETKESDYLHFMQELDLIFGSGKRIEFEERPKPAHFERLRKMFPGVRRYAQAGGIAKLVDEAVRREGSEDLRDFLKKQYGKISRMEIKTIARSLADSERIAREMGENPSQNRLMLRGAKHEVTTRLLRDAKIPVESLQMPARYGLAGTPLHGLEYKGLVDKVLLGKPMTASDIIRSHLERQLMPSYLRRGWNTPDAIAQIGYISRRLGLKDLEYLEERPHEVREYISAKKGIDPFLPWWKRGRVHASLAKYKKQRWKR